MATFAKTTFNASIYSASRPTYPSQLFEHIFSFHRRGSGKWDKAVDLGCGTGQATTQLQPFREVVGVDPSAGMLEKARVHVDQVSPGPGSPKFSFLKGSAEDLSKTLPNDSVDLLIAAQACHWFDWSKVWPETRRVLRQKGTAAFWVYGEFRLTHYPSLTPLITAYAQGPDLHTSVGAHFQRPGRTILERLLVDVPEPVTVLKDEALGKMERVYFCGDADLPLLPNSAAKHPIIMLKEMSWRDLLSYFRTWSALHTYHETFPDDLKHDEDARFLTEDLAAALEPQDDIRGGDISIRFWKDLRQGVLEIAPDASVGVEDKIQVEWPLALLLVRKE